MTNAAHSSPAGSVGKVEWRQWARTLAPVAPEIVTGVCGHLQQFLMEVRGDVGVYVGMPDEVPIDEVTGRGMDGIRWALPRINDSGFLGLHVDDGRRQTNAWGLTQPPADAPTVQPADLVALVVPARVFDRRGFRLGRGGGHYDRLIPQLSSGVPIIGVTCTDRIVGALPTESHDRPMTHLVTEHGAAMVDA